MDALEPGDPDQVGRYRLLGRLGGGGMGRVFLGETQGHRKVAIKLIRPEYARDPDFRLRFTREVEAARDVGGLHTALVVDADLEGDPPWMATAYIPGPSLAAQVNSRGPLDPAGVRDLGAALAEGLSAIHACGIIHRDLKPSNIIMADDGPRIIDFGIAKRASATTITPTGTPIGTFQYMSPEHLGAGDIGPASDVFSMGAVLAFAATGHAPFEAPEDSVVIGRILAQPPNLGGLASPLRDVVRACLAKEPALRPGLDELLVYFSGTESPLTPPFAAVHEAAERERAEPGTQWNQPAVALPFTESLGLGPPAEPGAAVGFLGAEPLEADGGGGTRNPPPFGLTPLIRAGGERAGDDQPRVRVRDLPPDVQLRFWRLRVMFALAVALVCFILIRDWAAALLLAILVGVADAVYRSRNAARYVSGGEHPAARKHTRRQMARIRREGYFTLDAVPIPGSREVIDHLVIGPTGVYAIDSEKWDPRLPIKTWNGKKLYLGPESQKERLEHAVWEAARAQEILTRALGTDIPVRPVLAIYGPKVPFDIATIRDVDVFTGWALRRYLRRRSRVRGVVQLSREEVRTIHDTAVRLLSAGQAGA